ncbi:2-isopropylmalate synthase [Leptospira ryugenii]|uniref:2-isopropylmalate synthase n=1 Tax=Leptospira ryugenii TaxID=1917863 RepID=A0A2P2DWC2_9LEPT|nr:hydroxymethylglutaryl-CoA lyase [Leptospira ryugenii]GBF48916.1 2-isopropylmalate synthase [Leptospira ryugenii]
METIKITEVGPRDGLQNEKKVLSTESKFVYIQKLAAAGLKRIEATSFVKKEKIPQMADASELSDEIFQHPHLSQTIAFSCLTPNTIAYEKALSAGYKEVAVFTATSETFTKKNINKTVRESLDAFTEIFQNARRDKIKVRAYISTVIACPYEGKILPEKTKEIAKRLLDEGAYEISLGETIGVAVPNEIAKLFSNLLSDIPKELFAGHFHDTYGMAIANVNEALRFGIRSFDSASGGLGGCPYAKGAAGNLATEDLVYFLERQGYETGIDLSKLVEASAYMQNQIARPLNSRTFIAREKDSAV